MQLATTRPAAAGSLHSFLAGSAISNDQVLSDLLVSADSVADTTLIVFDFSKQRTIHIGERIADLSGYSKSTAMEGGAAFIVRITNPEEVPYLMLLQTGYLQEAKSAGFDPCSLRYHDYYWSIINKEGSKVPVISTGITLTYTEQHDFEIGVGFHIRNNENSDTVVLKCKEILRRIKLRHNQVYRHCDKREHDGPYLLHHANMGKGLITDRERQVLGMLAQGHSTVAIADGLHIAANTVESHRKKLLQKFHARNTAQLILKASKVFWLT
jgi:DNA-binding CsgD family transcriptional regulator